MKKKPTFNLKTVVKGSLRRAFARWPPSIEIREDAIHPTIKGPRGGKQYTCACCGKTFGITKIAVDHISSVIPLDKTIDDLSWDEIVARMFCDKSNLQVLCKDVCHKKKTAEERKERKKYKILKQKGL